MSKKQYEKSALDKKVDKMMGYKEGSKADERMDALMMLKRGMEGKKTRKADKIKSKK